MPHDRRDLPFLDLTAPGFSTRSQAVFEARTTAWCARTPFGLAVLRHREAGQILRDPRFRQGSHAWPEIQNLQGAFADFWKRSIISQEGDTHRTLRRIAQSALAPDDITALAPQFSRIATALTDRLRPRDRFDFVAAFSDPFAGRAIAHLLALPDDAAARISDDAGALGLAMGLGSKRFEHLFNPACDRLMALAETLLDDASTGFVARLRHAAEIHGGVDRQALVDLVTIAIFGGVDTTRAQLGLAMALFADHPGQWQYLRNNPAAVPRAIEEVIRTRPTTTWSTREATEDIELSGVTVRRGETLHILTHATATDPAKLPGFGFDVRVSRPVHWGFGGGAHHCLGQFVARTDMAAALKVLLRVWSALDFADTPEWLPDTGNTGPAQLPLQVKWAE